MIKINYVVSKHIKCNNKINYKISLKIIDFTTLF